MDDEFIDIDFSTQPQFVRGDLGRNPSKLMCAAADDQVPLLAEDTWRGLAEQTDAAGGGLDRLVTRIFNQGQEGSCVANATTQLHQVMQAFQAGKSNVTQLSAISLYKRIGRSAQSGAMVDDGMEEACSRGILPLDTPANRLRFGSVVMPNTGFGAPFPANWQAVAAQFRGDERLIVRSTEAMFSCLFAGHPVCVGRAGHSILYLRPVWKNEKWLIKYVNSWGDTTWGEGFDGHAGGFGYDTKKLFESAADWAFTLRSVTMPTQLSL